MARTLTNNRDSPVAHEWMEEFIAYELDDWKEATRKATFGQHVHKSYFDNLLKFMQPRTVSLNLNRPLPQTANTVPHSAHGYTWESKTELAVPLLAQLCKTVDASSSSTTKATGTWLAVPHSVKEVP